jgi:hypothetical protein
MSVVIQEELISVIEIVDPDGAAAIVRITEETPDVIEVAERGPAGPAGGLEPGTIIDGGNF